MKIKILLFVLVFALGVSAQYTPKGGKTVAVRDKTEFLKIGETAPDFALSDLNGKQIKLSKAGMPVVLVFYRGYW